MQNINILQTKYSLSEAAYQLKLPIDLGIIIPENDCVRLLSQFVEGLDLTDLYSTYSRLRENQASPRQMLKILLYAYLEGIYASRGIEKACQKNVDFMYLLEGKPAPDHTTIARFRSIHFAPCATRILALTTEFLKSTGEISCKEIFIDGTKIEANANRYTFVWKKAVTKNMAKRFDKVAAFFEECENCYGLRPVWRGKIRLKHLKRLRRRLYAIREEEGIEFVHGTGKRKTQLQRHIEELEEHLAKIKEYTYRIHQCGERNSCSKTDPGATFMRMKEDYMMNGQLKPGYNLQIGVDSAYITWLTVSWHPTDTRTLKPFLRQMENELSFRYGTIVADAGYESEENYSYLEDHGQRAMIKPNNYEISRTRKYKRDISRRENMPYNYDGDYYTCRAGKRLHANGTFVRRERGSSYERKVTLYQCHECRGCPYKSECIRGRNWKTPEEQRFKQLEVSRKFERQRQESLANITSEEGAMLRMNRSIQAEGAFAVIKEDRGFRRFLCRGTENVLAESVLMAVSQNIAQLHRRIQNGKTGFHLYPLKH